MQATHHAYGIPSNDKVIGNTIFINNITFNNVKRYKCMASNTFGRDEQQFQLQDPSRFTIYRPPILMSMYIYLQNIKCTLIYVQTIMSFVTLWTTMHLFTV